MSGDQPESTPRPPIRTIRITGCFTDEQLKLIGAAVRTLDQMHPQNLITMAVEDPAAGTMDEGEALLRMMLPPLPERATVFAQAAYRDDTYPERACDRCGATYQGPAVYCSLKCAVADA